MNPGTSKLTSRKALRVATVFTGVASAAAFAAPGNAQAAVKFAPRPALQAMPDGTLAGNCAEMGEPPHYFHLFNWANYPNSSMCYGGAGYAWPDLWATKFCGGNNIGYFSGFTKSGKHLGGQRFSQHSYWYAFKPPKFKSSVFYFSFLHISTFDGNQNCGTGG